MTEKEEFERQVSELSKINIMVVGGTGVGKSSLINIVFDQEIAESGSGEPVTRGIQGYTSECLSAVIYDTEGFEVFDGDYENSNFNEVVIKEINTRLKLDLEDQMHLFWYCISVANHRVTDYDLINIRKLSNLGIDVAVVFTQCDTEQIDDNGRGLISASFRKIILDNGIKKEKIFDAMNTDGDNLQVDELIDWSLNFLNNKYLLSDFFEKRKATIDLEMYKIAKKYGQELSSDAQFYLLPKNSNKKLENAINSYVNVALVSKCLRDVDIGIPLILHDDTVFGSAKNGFLLTTKFVFAKESFSDPEIIALEEIYSCYFTEPSFMTPSYFVINNHKFYTFTQGCNKSPKAIIDIINEVKC